MFNYTLNTIKQPPSLKVKTNHPLIYSPLYWRAPIPMALSLLSFLPPPPTSTRSLSSLTPSAPRRHPRSRSDSPRPCADRRWTAGITLFRSRPNRAIGRAGPDAPSLKPSQGQYATLYLAAPLHELQLCSALSPGSLARLASPGSLALWSSRPSPFRRGKP